MKINGDVLVIGGGLQGCSAALHLAERGLAPIVIEKDYVGRHASGVNAGGVRTLGRDPAELPLSLAAKRLWQDIAALVDDDCGFRACGQIRVAETDAELQGLRRRSALVAALGLPHVERMLDRDELRARLPALAPHCVGGIAVDDDGYANPFRATAAFRRQAERRKVRFHERSAVVHIARTPSAWQVRSVGGDEFTAPVLLNCAGAWGGRVAALLGDAVPLEPNGSMLLVTGRMAPFVRPVVGAAGRPLSFKQFDNGTVLVGGGHRSPVDLDTNATSLDLRRLALAARTAAELFPVMRGAQAVRFWSGIEGFTPDRLPVIGPSCAAPQAFHAFGFSAHGFQLGPVVGRILADLVVGGRTELPIGPFRVERFARAPAERVLANAG
jgi:sarcosine oxidase subunit beta